MNVIFVGRKTGHVKQFDLRHPLVLAVALAIFHPAPKMPVQTVAYCRVGNHFVPCQDIEDMIEIIAREMARQSKRGE